MCGIRCVGEVARIDRGYAHICGIGGRLDGAYGLGYAHVDGGDAAVGGGDGGVCEPPTALHNHSHTTFEVSL